MKEGTSNIISGSVIILVGILLLLETTKPQYAGMPGGIGTGPAFFPRVLMCGFIITGMLTIINGLKHKGAKLPPINKIHLLLFISLTAAFFIAVPHFGFLLTAFPFLVTAMLLMGFRKKAVIMVIALCVSVISWYLFNFVFEIILPVSPWFIYI